MRRSPCAGVRRPGEWTNKLRAVGGGTGGGAACRDGYGAGSLPPISRCCSTLSSRQRSRQGTGLASGIATIVEGAGGRSARRARRGRSDLLVMLPSAANA